MGVNAYNDGHNRLLVFLAVLAFLAAAGKMWLERREKGSPAPPQPAAAEEQPAAPPAPSP